MGTGGGEEGREGKLEGNNKGKGGNNNVERTRVVDDRERRRRATTSNINKFKVGGEDNDSAKGDDSIWHY